MVCLLSLVTESVIIGFKLMGNYTRFNVLMAVTDYYYYLLGYDTILFLDRYQHFKGTQKMEEAHSSECCFLFTKLQGVTFRKIVITIGNQLLFTKYFT
jgi:hypothetical protein